MNAKQLVKAFLTDLIESDASKKVQLEQYLHPDITQHVDGKTLNFQQCYEHMLAVKRKIKTGRIHFEHLIAEGHSVCSVHIAEGETIDGRYVKFKVIAYFELKDGLIYIFDELTRLVSGSEEDQDLTSRH